MNGFNLPLRNLFDWLTDMQAEENYPKNHNRIRKPWNSGSTLRHTQKKYIWNLVHEWNSFLNKYIGFSQFGSSDFNSRSLVYIRKFLLAIMPHLLLLIKGTIKKYRAICCFGSSGASVLPLTGVYYISMVIHINYGISCKPTRFFERQKSLVSAIFRMAKGLLLINQFWTEQVFKDITINL